MKIILLGAPGAGKGTQAALIKDRYGIPHISTGDIFRANIREGTPLGIKVKSIIDSGNLVPDGLTVEIVKDRLSKPDCDGGYILDGFPRTLAQAEALDGFTDIDVVIDVAVPAETVVKRISGRRMQVRRDVSHIYIQGRMLRQVFSAAVSARRRQGRCRQGEIESIREPDQAHRRPLCG